MPAAKEPLPSFETALIESARDAWVNRLIDTSRRNNLLFFRPVLGGSIEIESSNAGIRELLTGETVAAASLLPDAADRPLRVLNIARKALENLEEKGLQTLYLALGFATWKAEDGGRDYRAPVFLFPLTFKRKGSEHSSFEVAIAGEPQINPVLLHVLGQHFGTDLSPEILLPAHREEMPGVNGAEGNSEVDPLAPYRERLEFFAASLPDAPGFNTNSAAVVGNFAFAKMAMVNDLREAETALFQNKIIAAIAGDSKARESMATEQVNIDPRSLDSHSPDDEFCVVEADSSQQCAIDGIAAGQSAIVHGPPGTGKSQTITNLIATLVARGKTVLFVAEKRAALEVVLHRLHRSRLDHLAIDLHGAELSPKEVMERVAETLNAVRHAKLPDCDNLHRQFIERRVRLNEHDERMHRISPRMGMSLFAMEGRLLALARIANSEVRWRGPELERLTPSKRGGIRDALRELGGYASLFLRIDTSPWTGIAFKDGTTVQRAYDEVRALLFDALPVLSSAIANVTSALGFESPKTFTQTEELTAFLRRVATQLETFEAGAFTSDLVPILAELERASSPFKALWLSLTSSTYRGIYREAVGLRKGRKVSAAQLANELRGIRAEALRWRELTNGKSTPTSYVGLGELEARTRDARQHVAYLQNLRGASWDSLTFAELEAIVLPYSKDQTTPYKLLKVTELETALENAGAKRLVEEIRRMQPPPERWPDTFDAAWISSAIDELARNDPGVKGFAGQIHNQYVKDFKGLDAERLKMAIERVRRSHALRAIQAMNDHPTQEAFIRAEAAKARRHKPLRVVFDEAWDVLTAVCPCWMASPLSVSQLISRDAKFDYVIFDEASQVLPEDAVPSLMRAKHIVVAGDNQQLPPTGFFAAGMPDDGDDEELSAAEGFESLLDMMLPFAKSFHLNWHYRSRDEALIAFSNRNIYKDRLVTFPGPGGPPSVSHILVEHVPNAYFQEESCAEEVRRVVQLVIAKAETAPTRTLGVIAMGIKHANRLQGALDAALRNRHDLSEFFDTERSERFFIKNLERVQGDERDSIIISVGYGKNRGGDLPLRFGPILAAAGRRRLNVAITRARETMTVVSSFSHLDIDATKVREGKGLEFLRNFLQYAASGGKLISMDEGTSEPMNDFETDIYTVLEARGMKLVPQVGCSQFRIDFGVCHPNEPGRFVMAIECDGATYHSSATARDRDRLRQQMLENLGWSFHRIWSTDWFLRKEQEADRAWAAFQAALDNSKHQTAEHSSHESTEIEGEEKAGGSSITRYVESAPIASRGSITEYSPLELRKLYEWVTSDGALRTHDQIADEMFEALPFTRRGPRIDATLKATIASCERR